MHTLPGSYSRLEELVSHGSLAMSVVVCFAAAALLS